MMYKGTTNLHLGTVTIFICMSLLAAAESGHVGKVEAKKK